MAIKRHQAGPRMSQAVVHGDTVYLAGQVADDTSANVAGQTRQVLEKIDALLQQAGTDKTRLLSANVWLADISSFAEMNSAWEAWVSPGNTPARATVQSTLAGPQYKVEIMVVAAGGSARGAASRLGTRATSRKPAKRAGSSSRSTPRGSRRR
jgi:enamine deaminase RidA (YjgF/YER057c/UK114 family)